MKTTLVAVSGMSPAIITETLWALAEESPAVVPDDVVIITTSRGESDIRRELLGVSDTGNGKSVWQEMRDAILKKTGRADQSSRLQLSLRVIDLPDPSTGVRKPADDLRTGEHNAEAADFIVRILAPLCDARDHHVIASIAGGRKTMGALLYAAMSLLGKESDRVTHVLVSEPFENVRGFFYPDQHLQKLEARPFGQAPVSVLARDAKIELADIPFVPLRNKFKELDEPRRTFAGLVRAYSKENRRLAGPPTIELNVDAGFMKVEGRDIPLGGRNLIICDFLYQRFLRKEPHFANKHEAGPELDRFFANWKSQHKSHKALSRLSGGVTMDDIPKVLSFLRSNLVSIGLEDAVRYLAPDRDRIGFDARA